MKRQSWKVGTFLAAVLATSIAVGQSNQGVSVADIPFPFTVANHSFPPGRYTVTPVNQILLRIFNSHHQGTIVLAHSTDGVAPEEGGRMVFHRYGDAYFLSEVWDPASRTGHRLAESRIESQLMRKQAAVEFAVLKVHQ